MYHALNDVAVVIPSYDGMYRLRKMVESLKRNDLEGMCNTQIAVIQDKSDVNYDEVRNEYAWLCSENGFKFHALDEWSNMHGAAQKAFEYAVDIWSPRWIIYLGDDVFFTKGSLMNMIHFVTMNDLDTVGLVQFPYWNTQDLSDGGHCEFKGPELFWHKRQIWGQPLDWTDKVPPHPHWNEGVAREWGQEPGIACPYVNVNGCGFACKTETWIKAGGFAEGTWCLDESISVRTWMKSDQSIVALPGPPLVHYFGGATESDPPKHDLYTEEAWAAAMHMSKHEAGEISRKIMGMRAPAVIDEMKRCSYYEH